MTDEWSGDLVARWRAGDQEAATELFRRYASRLAALARKHLSTNLAARIDPEDVVQSAYRSFFTNTRDGRYEFRRGGDLWQLLARITLHKVQHHVKRVTAQKRAAAREQTFGSEDSLAGIPARGRGEETSPLEAAVLTDLLQQLMCGLEAPERRILELRLQGHELEEIAAATGLSRRTVCRVLKDVKGQLECWQSTGIV